MDPLYGVFMVADRGRSTDLAFSALPDAPRQPDPGPGRVRRGLGWLLLRAAHRVEPATRRADVASTI